MPASTLEQLVGELLDERFRVLQVLRNEPERALLRVAEELEVEAAREAIVILDLSTKPEDRFKRFLEAKFLSHPNLAPCFRVGWLEIDGTRHPWMATEIPESILGDVLHHDTPLEASDLVTIVKQAADGLEYLHSENLAYCALRPETIWRVNGQWALSDFSQLRVIGSPALDSGEISAYAREVLPPEAARNEVSPEWDIWALAPIVARAVESVPLPEAAKSPALKSKKRNPAVGSDPLMGENFLRNISSSNPLQRPSLTQITKTLTILQSNQMTAEITQPAAPGDNAQVSKREQPRLLDREEILKRQQPLALEPERTVPWMRVLQAAVVVIIAFLAALFLGRAMTHANGRDAGKASDALNGTALTTSFSTRPKQSSQALAPPILAPVPSNEGTAPPEIREQIASALNNWVAATKARNAEAIVDCYAPVVDTYFSRHQMSAYELTREKERSLAEIGPIRTFSIADIHYDRVTSNSVVVTFVKTWAFGGERPFSGSAREQMILRPFSDRWKISSERELKAY